MDIEGLLYMRKYIVSILIAVILYGYTNEAQSKIQFDTIDDWKQSEFSSENLICRKSDNLNGIIDLMGNGALLLEKVDEKELFQKTTAFKSKGVWTSKWQTLGKVCSVKKIKAKVIVYGNPIDIRKGWTKFSGNPLLSGENTLLPLNKKNITDQTILLPEPGGVPQDQAILLGNNKWEGKWLLFFNHTPHKWPHDYYWSFAVADSLTPLKQGINPFKLDSTVYPLFGPIDGQAPNDWLEVDGVYYAPDETHAGESHMWRSKDLTSWQDLGAIAGILGSDPGLAYDGKYFYLFNENGSYLTYNRLNDNLTRVVEGDTVLNVGDHTGDADLGFFNNQWHMFFDDGVHLHYNIGYAVTSADKFPYGWQLENDIYGPYNPDQGQSWDNDTEEGNNFGTGDADIALEKNTIYMFTERPIGAAYKQLAAIYKNSGQSVRIKVEVKDKDESQPFKSTDWTELEIGNQIVDLKHQLKGSKFRIKLELNSTNPEVSPMVRKMKIIQ